MDISTKGIRTKVATKFKSLLNVILSVGVCISSDQFRNCHGSIDSALIIKFVPSG